MKHLFVGLLISLNCIAAEALPDWMPGKKAIEEKQIVTWNTENRSACTLELRTAAILANPLKQLSFSGFVRNAGAEKIESWILELQAVDAQTKQIVLTRRVRFIWSTPTSINRNFENVKFWTPGENSEYYKISASLGRNFGWNYKVIAAVPEKFKSHDIEKIYGIESNEIWISHD